MACHFYTENAEPHIHASSHPTQVGHLQSRCCGEAGEEDENETCSSMSSKTPGKSRSDDSLRLFGRSDEASSSQQPIDTGTTDVEKGSSCSEHVVLRFTGSNCPGCTSNITKALKSMASISNFRMNQILLQADFDLDCTKASRRDVVEAVRKRTGLACKVIEDGWRELEVVVLGNSKKLTDSILPAGVRSVTALSKDIFSIKYDAKILGARSLLKALNLETDGTVYLAPPKFHDGVPTEVRKMGWLTLLSSILTLPILVLAWAPLPENEMTYGIISLVFATVIQIVIAGPFYPRALRSLYLTRVIDMDLLVVLSTSITYGFSVASFICQTKGVQLVSEVYFETSALLMTLIMMGRLIGDLACHRAIKSTSIKSYKQRFATLVDTSDLYAKNETKVDVRLLQYGDVVRVKPGQAVVADGTIISGVSEFDESVMTGELSPVARSIGSAVIAGAINRGSVVLVQVTRLLGETAIDEIAMVVEEVMHSKPTTQQTADRVAAWIVPAAGLLALLTLVIWFVVAKFVQNLSAERAILKAVPYTISVLVVSCPCAIGMAVPIVLMIASAVGTKHGVVFRSAEAMMVARNATHVVFDSTGTLTKSCLSVVTENYFTSSQSLTAALTCALTYRSEHPVSIAVTKHLESRGIELASVTNLTPVVGKGAEALWNGELVRVGNADWLGVDTLPQVQTLLSRDLTVLCVTLGGRLLATFGMDAPLREDASSVFIKLVERGIKVSIMSGNETGAVHRVADELGIPSSDVKARCTPIEKQQHIKELMNSSDNVVIFCGDGINDEAALAQANVGLRIGNGGGMMHTGANAFLTGPSLSGLLTLIELSHQSHWQIVFNFTWAAIYNVFAILLAAGAFVKFRLSPEFAGLGEAVSILPVILVPMHLWWKTFP